MHRPIQGGIPCVVLQPAALIARLAAIVPPPRRHVTRYFGVLSSHSSLRSQVVPMQTSAPELPPEAADEAKPPSRFRYISWAELLRRTWGIDVLKCDTCGGRMRLIALVKTDSTIKKILGAMGLPTEPPQPHPARPPPPAPGKHGGGDDRLN
jgi:hypothetical protein